MGRALWRIRAARRSDRARLERFECARDGSSEQAEVAEFIRDRVLDWALEPLARMAIRGCCFSSMAKATSSASRPMSAGCFKRPMGKTFSASKLEVVALSTDWQGKAFSDGTRASDVLMSAVMKDISTRVPPRDARVFAFVHEDNKASIKLLKRYGLVQEMDRLDEAYLRLITEHRY